MCRRAFPLHGVGHYAFKKASRTELHQQQQQGVWRSWLVKIKGRENKNTNTHTGDVVTPNHIKQPTKPSFVARFNIRRCTHFVLLVSPTRISGRNQRPEVNKNPTTNSDTNRQTSPELSQLCVCVCVSLGRPKQYGRSSTVSGGVQYT